MQILLGFSGIWRNSIPLSLGPSLKAVIRNTCCGWIPFMGPWCCQSRSAVCKPLDCQVSHLLNKGDLFNFINLALILTGSDLLTNQQICYVFQSHCNMWLNMQWWPWSWRKILLKTSPCLSWKESMGLCNEYNKTVRLRNKFIFCKAPEYCMKSKLED